MSRDVTEPDRKDLSEVPYLSEAPKRCIISWAKVTGSVNGLPIKGSGTFASRA